MQSFIYEFEELPLAIVNGIEAGFINGQVEVDYSGSFEFRHVTLEGFGRRINGKREWPQVPAPDAVADIVRHRLENEWYDKVHSAFLDHLESEREAVAENRADMRREDRMGAF